MIEQPVNTLLSFLQKVPDIVRASESDSLIKYTEVMRVEPLVLIDDRCVDMPMIHDTLQTVNSIFCGYYLQGAALSKAQLAGVDVVGMLDRLNPRRSLSDNAVRGILNAAAIGQESHCIEEQHYEYALPVPGEPTGALVYGTEAYDSVYDAFRSSRAKDNDGDDENNEDNNDTRRSKSQDGGYDGNISVRDTAIKAAQEVNNLAVGKMLSIQVTVDNKSVEFPVSVRLITSSTPSAGIVQALSVGHKPYTAKERWNAWRTGQIQFVQDILLCQDLIDAHQEGLINDTSGLYSDSIKRRRRNRLSAILTGSFSVATASAIVVMSIDTQKALEREVRAPLDDFRNREKIFKATMTMLIVVIDPEWETVTIYHRGIERATELSSADIKHKGRNQNGPDISEILKAYMAGSAPSI